MRNQNKCLWGAFALLLSMVHRADAASQPRDRWQTILLISNEVLSARLQVLRVASAADRDWMILEIKNLTGKPLSIQQTWFGLDAERRDLITDKPICSGSLGPGSEFEIGRAHV